MRFAPDSSLECVGDMCFYDSGLAFFEAPDGLLYIGSEAFALCSQLEWVGLGRSLEGLGVGAFQFSAVQTVNFPETLAQIESCAFAHCRDLTHVGFAHGLQQICSRAFHGAGLEETVIPASVQYIGDLAFCDCEDLATVIYQGEPPPLGKHVFRRAAVEPAMWAHPGWREFRVRRLPDVMTDEPTQE